MQFDKLAINAPMTIQEAAAYLSVTPRTVDRFICEDELPVHRMGDGPKAQKRFYRSELDAWLRSRCSDNTPAREVAS